MMKPHEELESRKSCDDLPEICANCHHTEDHHRDGSFDRLVPCGFEGCRCMDWRPMDYEDYLDMEGKL